MKRLVLFIVVAAGAASLLAASAAAKGPSEASVEGPGLKSAIVFGGDGEGPGSPLGDLADGAGFFPAVFDQTPNPMLPGRPKGDLGPRYTITYTVPGPSGTDEIRQDLYPYAQGGAVTYMAPGQPIFDMTTRGGWYTALPSLKDTLVDAGLPASAPTTAGGGSGSSWLAESWAWILVGILSALVLAAASLLLVRRARRVRPAAAA